MAVSSTSTMQRSNLMLLLVCALSGFSSAFEFPTLPKFAFPKFSPEEERALGTSDVTKQKRALLSAISGTANGKTATIDQQKAILKMVRNLETTAPPPSNLLSIPADDNELNGVWYLQYTSPSEITSGENDETDDGDDNDIWKPKVQEEGIESSRFQAKGTISAAGIRVDTSNRPTQQAIDIKTSRVTNQVELDWGRVTVEGTFEPSPAVPNRVLVAFDTATLQYGQDESGPALKLGFLFDAIAFFKGGNRNNGWLEVTYLDGDMRIGRGNKGTMFVLTRDPNAVTP